MSQEHTKITKTLFISERSENLNSIRMDKDKAKDRAELYIEYLEDGVRELVVNFSEKDSELSNSLAQRGS